MTHRWGKASLIEILDCDEKHNVLSILPLSYHSLFSQGGGKRDNGDEYLY